MASWFSHVSLKKSLKLNNFKLLIEKISRLFQLEICGSHIECLVNSALPTMLFITEKMKRGRGRLVRLLKLKLRDLNKANK